MPDSLNLDSLFDAALVERMLNELLQKQEYFAIGLKPFEVLQLVGILQLATRHPEFPETHRAPVRKFIHFASDYFSDCPTVLNVIQRGDDPTFDRLRQNVFS